MMDREEIEALGEGAGGLGRQEVDDLLELHDAHAALARVARGDTAAAVRGSAEPDPRGTSPSAALRNDRGRLCYLGREMRDGPWHGEPDLVEFQYAGLICLAERSRNGTWCGYVELPADHPWRGVIGDLSRGNVHGGICRIRPRRGAPDAEFVGFECDHVDLDDLIPSHPSTHASYSEYRDLAFVRGDVERMAEMARDAAATTPED